MNKYRPVTYHKNIMEKRDITENDGRKMVQTRYGKVQLHIMVVR